MKVYLYFALFFFFGNSQFANSVGTQSPNGHNNANSDEATETPQYGNPSDPKLDPIAKLAADRAAQHFCLRTDSPPNDLKCAAQASDILATALNDTSLKTDGVKDLYDKLKAKGWKPSKYPVPGAVALSNPDIPETKAQGGEHVRSHAGVVYGPKGASKNNLCIVNNSGAMGGCQVSTGVTPSTKCDEGGPGASSANQDWASKVIYMVPGV